MDIGFIGLGNMGYPMARRLVEAGHKLIVYDTSGQMMSRLTAIGAVAAKSARDVADQVETVMASLPTPDIVLAVATGKDGVIEGKKVKRFLDLSTTGARMATRVAAALQEKNITGIDLPVSGGVGGAEKGTLAVMYAGPRDGFEELKPVLSVIGKPFFIGDKPGMGQTMKLCNNLLSAAAMALSSEVMVMGTKAGLDPATMVDVINAGSGANTAVRDKFPARGDARHLRLRLLHRPHVQGRAALRRRRRVARRADAGRRRGAPDVAARQCRARAGLGFHRDHQDHRTLGRGRGAQRRRSEISPSMAGA